MNFLAPSQRPVLQACCASFLLLSMVASARAQHRPEQVLVTGAREPLQRHALAADVVSIDAETIRASAADSVEDLLRREAGLQISRNGGPGKAASVFIRGANGGNTLVLVDGVRVGSATLGLPEFETISLASVDHIEVLRGPASSLYGADGSGGVVQIFTRRGSSVPQASARLALGGYGAREGSLQASHRHGALDIAVGLSHERAEGVSALRPGDQYGNYNPDRDGFSRTTAQTQLGLALAPGQRIGLTALNSRVNSQYDASEYPAPTYAQDNTPDFRNRQRSQVLALEHRADWSAAWASTLRLSGQDSDSRSGGHQIDRFRTQRQQLDAQATWRAMPGQQLTLALEVMHDQALADAFGGELSRRNQALVLAYAGTLAGASVQVDVRHDRNSAFGAVNTGRIGASWPLVAGWRVRTLAGSSFRAPSYNDLYYPGYGVATLRPESSHSLEAGMDGRLGPVDLSATVFRNRARDLINYEPNRAFCPGGAAYDYGCAANVGRARLQGANLGASLKQGAWNLRAGLDFLDAKDSATGQRLPRRAAHQQSLSLGYNGGAWGLGAELINTGARPDSGIQLPAQTLLDLKAHWQFAPQWTLEAKLHNAGNVDVVPARDYQGLGRQAWLGLRWTLAGR